MITANMARRMLADERRHQMLDAMKVLFRRLEKWVQVDHPFPEEVGDHRVYFVTGVDDGPDRVVEDAIRGCPALWAGALPDSVVIVPRRTLEGVGLSDDVIDYFASMGVSAVETHAAKHRAMAAEKEDRKRMATIPPDRKDRE
jgi:hypothetical protein